LKRKKILKKFLKLEMESNTKREKSLSIGDRFDQREGFTKSQRGPMKLSTKSGRNSSQGYFQQNQPTK
jgi:hypothetical protein